MIPVIPMDELMSFLSILDYARTSINELPNLRASVDNSGHIPELVVRIK